ncbi:hypothetical protein BDZ90DRAFT_249986 [Jaminaea rosea]|uniref:Vacuolar sorting protein 39/Transforming growth factor beta receptor-associated domain-containing protein n=1 Tax=Jaminaea rosea TaxID=1569628 RepID=A0A316UU44_9BASI|nr:hypothetical protein BDZ90DRAFT_249986 [Jaminaea rosea]PWN28809.1 hypothetical protein BDZ90DRAFT_249986 [Jaminaea rosea]
MHAAQVGFEAAVEQWIELDLNPAKVLSIFPESIAGQGLTALPSDWIKVWGEGLEKEAGTDAASLRSATTSPTRSSERDGFDPQILTSRPALEALGRFLADRRRIFKPILEDRLPVTPTPHEAMLSLPSVPLPSMSLQDVTALARVVDTSLFKTFLETKPSLVGPLCRIQNWCEVSEVEEILEAKGKFSELIHLYGGKDMHDRALKLLKKFADEEDDEEEKVGPTIRYLQSLGPEHIGVILENAKWVLAEDRQRGMEIFTADTGKVSQLPRLEVVELLWSIDEDMCAEYLEHIIHQVGDGDPELHERLAHIYLRRVRNHPGESDHGLRLLTFLSQSQQYRPERVLTQLPSEGLWEVRAVLLGKMGRHQGALSILVERIGGEEGRQKAEAYCADVYARRSESGASGEEKNIFLLLFTLYLRTGTKQQAEDGEGSLHLSDLDAALRLLSVHAASMDLSAVLDLLPPLVPLSSLRAFLVKGLQASHRRKFDSSILSSVCKERDSQLDEGLAVLRGRRVKVTQGRTCPVCGKRLGVSVIAVTSRGEVLHYGCRQAQQQQVEREQRDWEIGSKRSPVTKFGELR